VAFVITTLLPVVGPQEDSLPQASTST